QHYRAADGLPYIGRAIGSARVLIATGFATDGLVYGTVAAQVIGDDLLGRANECAALYSPRRFTPLKSALSFLVENSNAARCMIRDHVGNGEAKDVGDIAPGQGRIVELQGKKLAVYRDQNAVLHALSAVCTHLKCVVHWNCAEHTWDCPCHGSRFDIDGQVIEGPALAPLRPYPLEQHTPQQESIA
ncbi:MAG TPA: Rieske 2Fe-2S domain-containing protein, partial [Burkholderiaceae bacterium]|nr:Rieske 2Fe-2S domain-containing protein [Burkholderiaceae bacterium]